ncbi:hypothetical protein Gotri_019079 [Gossypium trilobum]|uniref:Uncharacterized protein n=2 Tax=Gossypium TaxID=3633 RepID=A0A7J9ECF8_9ROSI|nr:hypothetical protein [Gossypium lobatum]MBA0770444.1 hypothetical protein [Gossypium trilobum]
MANFEIPFFCDERHFIHISGGSTSHCFTCIFGLSN